MNPELLKEQETAPFHIWLVESAIASAQVANFCDKREHIENVRPETVSEAALALRGLAMEIAEYQKVDIFDLYTERIRAIEERNVLDGHDFSVDAEQANTWPELQRVQFKHNNYYHPDVAGLSKFEQIRHYAFHTSKLTGQLAEQSVEGSISKNFEVTRLPDFLIFGILLSTVINEQLEDIPLPRNTVTQ